ncbi:MAG: hypothetical protein JEY91_15990 [Spirochaetaceae bacterium]|nr:hypothetical protein [Spirochaetaceae bacterium]
MKKNTLWIFEKLIEDNLEISPQKNKNKDLLLNFLKSLSDNSEMRDPFFSKALEHIREETKEISLTDGDTGEQRLKSYWEMFFPEGLLFFEDWDKIISDIREDRTIRIKELNEERITDVPGQMTFTSNVLLTIPDKKKSLDELDLPESIKIQIPEIINEEQLYWFDHPVQMGEIQEKNEIIYGLKGLSEAFAFEKKSGFADPQTKLDVLLSVSVTHKGLQKLAAPYLRYELSKCDKIKDLNIYIFTESDCRDLLSAYSDHSESISRYFGVDGKYGRHYNFLKAVNVLWKQTMNTHLKGTFKIDLDQVFPQKKLVENTGKSAFQHFMSPLWGAQGTDNRGKSVDLSMIAGALVNEADIEKSLFTPDVSFPDLHAPVNDLVFFKHLSMALSTRAELMTRYDKKGDLDGKNKVISRIHVTGGTNGILIDALNRHRPFTPAFIGRAEDQAYILSVLNSSKEPLLRYYHEDGLIMRHDKQAFAGESIKAAKDGTYIADILRILYYTYYAEALPGGRDKTKKETFPFTGSYISRFPITLSYMRLVFKLLEMYEEGLTERADEMLNMGRTRLQPLIEALNHKNFLIEEYIAEKDQWDLFYDEAASLNPMAKERVKMVFNNSLVT